MKVIKLVVIGVVSLGFSPVIKGAEVGAGAGEQRTLLSYLCGHTHSLRDVGQGKHRAPVAHNAGDTEFECPICLESRKDVRTVITPICGHKNCLRCWDQQKQLDCSMCRRETTKRARYMTRGAGACPSPAQALLSAGGEQYAVDKAHVDWAVITAEIEQEKCPVCRGAAPLVEKPMSEVDAKAAAEAAKKAVEAGERMAAEARARIEAELKIEEARGAYECCECEKPMSLDEANGAVLLATCTAYMRLTHHQDNVYHYVHDGECAQKMATSGNCVECYRSLSNNDEKRLNPLIAAGKRTKEAFRRGDAQAREQFAEAMRKKNEDLQKKAAARRAKRNLLGAARMAVPVPVGPGAGAGVPVASPNDQTLADALGLPLDHYLKEKAAGKLG